MVQSQLASSGKAVAAAAPQQGASAAAEACPESRAEDSEPGLEEESEGWSQDGAEPAEEHMDADPNLMDETGEWEDGPEIRPDMPHSPHRHQQPYQQPSSMVKAHADTLEHESTWMNTAEGQTLAAREPQLNAQAAAPAPATSIALPHHLPEASAPQSVAPQLSEQAHSTAAGKQEAAAADLLPLLQQQQNLVRTVHTPIQALPPASQLDGEVLDALPLPLKRELERAYGAPSMTACS